MKNNDEHQEDYTRQIRDYVSARRAERLSLGLTCLPDPVYGDMVEVVRLRDALSKIMIHVGQVCTAQPMVMSGICGMCREALDNKKL